MEGEKVGSEKNICSIMNNNKNIQHFNAINHSPCMLLLRNKSRGNITFKCKNLLNFYKNSILS